MRSRPAIASPEAQTADLYEQYGQDIYRFCSRRLRSHEEAEDAVQNTFLRVYGALRKGIVPEFETAWLYKIAHNVCLSRIAGKTRVSDFETLDDGELLDTVGSPYSTGDSDELFGLDEALARMPENLRRAILLREWQGLSYAEIAEILGVSQSAVETLIFRARKHLAQALEGSVKRPARRVVAGLNLGSALGALRGWLIGASGAAKLAAAGALAVGLAGGGVLVERAVVSPASSAPKRSQPGVVSGSPARVAVQPGSQSGSQARATGAGQVIGSSAPAQKHSGATSGAQSAAAGTGSVGGRTSAGGSFAPAATPGPTSGGAPQQPRGRKSSPGSPPPGVPSGGIPSAPTPTAPTPSLPAFPTPTLPASPAPPPPTDGVTLPTVSTPGVPSVSTPSVPSGGNVSTPATTVSVPLP